MRSSVGVGVEAAKTISTENPVAENDDSPVAEIVTDARDTVDAARRFWKTKRAIDRGEPLYEWSSDRLGKAGYYGPWKFNAFATAVTGGVAGAVNGIVSFVNNSPEDSSEPTLLVEAASALGGPAVSSMAATTSAWIQPFVVPLVTTSLVFLVAWGSLKSHDSTKATRARARRAYLYADGAFGFFPQLLLASGGALLLGVLSGVLSRHDDADGVVQLTPFLIVLVAVVVVAGLAQTIVSQGKIPRFLFAINGYQIPYYMWQRVRLGDAPWIKLTLAQFIGLGPVAAAVELTLGVLTISLAFSLVWIQGLFQ